MNDEPNILHWSRLHWTGFAYLIPLLLLVAAATSNRVQRLSEFNGNSIQYPAYRVGIRIDDDARPMIRIPLAASLVIVSQTIT